MATTAEAKKTVLLGTIGTGVLTSIAVVTKTASLPGPRIGVGVFVTGVLLSGMAEFLPSLAAGFAALMLVTAMFVLGGPAWAGISNISTIS